MDYVIGVGLASSIPPFNLVEVNNALIKLLWNEETPIDEIICLPDFPTGGILLNRDEVIESLKKGTGKSCRIRSFIEFDSKNNVLIVKEIPYSVYTNTICRELEKLIEENPSCGIDRFNDLTGKEPNIKIYLKKNASAEKVIKLLYKETSLQSYYSINMTMLKDGRTPKVFNWKEALVEHLNYEKICYKRAFEYDLNKLTARLHIVDGIIKAISIIKEVIDCIKNSKSTSDAKDNLVKEFGFSDLQAKAILEIKLARLANLEIAKYAKEKEELEVKIDNIKSILSDEILFKKEIEKGFIQVRDSYGDERRTKVMNLDFSESEDDTPIEKKEMVINLLSTNTIYTYEDTTLIAKRRGSMGTKFKLEDYEFVMQTIQNSNYTNLVLFTNLGNAYSLDLNNVSLDSKTSLNSLLPLKEGERVNLMANVEDKENKFIIFTTKNGLVKKSLLSDYNFKKSTGIIAIKLKDGDELVSVNLINDENYGIITKNSYFTIFNSEEITPTGRATSGVKGIKLKAEDEVIGAVKIGKKTKYLTTVTNCGKIKKTKIEEFNVTQRGNSGVIAHKLNDDDTIAAVGTLENEEDIILVSSNSSLKFSSKEVPEVSRNATGNKAITLKNNSKVCGMVII